MLVLTIFSSLISALPTYFELQTLLNCIKILDVETVLISAGNWHVNIFVVKIIGFFLSYPPNINLTPHTLQNKKPQPSIC